MLSGPLLPVDGIWTDVKDREDHNAASFRTVVNGVRKALRHHAADSVVDGSKKLWLVSRERNATVDFCDELDAELEAP